VGRRLFDIGAATAALVLLSPLMLLVGLAIRVSSDGPVIFRAPRVGLRGKPFSMFKFRTMIAGAADSGSAITGSHDPRVYPLGRLLRRSKIDELPQLVNVLRGEMAVVGPRPEDPRVVATWYRPEHLATLEVRPGLASPGSLYNFTHGESQLGGPDAEADYVQRVLPVKLALDVIYVQRASLRYDLVIVVRTLFVIAAATLGKRRFGEPAEMAEARKLAPVS
jgi:lipopolysaccharide/colanic/teichoic acid biosynthesis glycosyltransferase